MPSSIVKELVGKTEAATESKDIATLRGMISETYGDGEGRTKSELAGLLAYHFFRHRTIHLFTVVREAEETAPGRIDAVVFVAMAGRPVTRMEDLFGIRADLYRFEIICSREAKKIWRVVRASWRPAKKEDFRVERL